VDDLADRQPSHDTRGVLNVARLGTLDYPAGLALQDALVNARRYDRIPDTLLLLEHPHVFTLGRGADERYLINPPAEAPIYRVSRGGQVTYHGPGQLIGYPIVKLEGRDRDVHQYLRMLEQVIIDGLDAIGIVSGRREKLTGVWVGQRKIASIGVGIRRWVTFHGFAVNVAPAMSYFSTIVPCGIQGCEMTSIAEQFGYKCADAAAQSDLMSRFTSLIQQNFGAQRRCKAVNTIGAQELLREAGGDIAGGQLITSLKSAGEYHHG
jgi:lipoyl(octanoyl) transferase